MKIMTLNINGIRAGATKGFFDYLAKESPDIVCLQEVKAQADQLTDPIFSPKGYHVHYVAAQKKGYSGVAIYSKQKPDNIITTLNHPVLDGEGRYLQFDFGNLSVVSLYLPSGTTGDERQAVKMQLLQDYLEILKKQMQSGREFIICGDVNIAHQPIDLKNWKSNQKNSGFLPEERAWLDVLFNEVGFVDAFRVINQEPEQYTWWTYRARAWENKVGWRIDYHLVTPGLKDSIQSASIYKNERFSDHAPLAIEYNFSC
jgi:exodeoxyribonuclease-3